MTNSRAKGKRIEREAVNLLKDELGDGYVVERNLQQTRQGGADILLNGFAIEVKSGPRLQTAWFRQAKEQADRIGAIPVLMWKPPRQPFRIWVEHNGVEFAQLIRESVYTWPEMEDAE